MVILRLVGEVGDGLLKRGVHQECLFKLVQLGVLLGEEIFDQYFVVGFQKTDFISGRHTFDEFHRFFWYDGSTGRIVALLEDWKDIVAF